MSGIRRFFRRLRYTWVWYTGNLYADNRRYWGWVKLRTAWEAAKFLSRD